MASIFLSQLGDLSPIISFFGWWILPGYISSLVLAVAYRFRPSIRPAAPVASSIEQGQRPTFNPMFEVQKDAYERRSRLHRSIAHGFVICVYLGYTLISTYHEQHGSNYYSVLGLKSDSLDFTTTPPGTVKLFPGPEHKVTKSSSLDEAGFKSHWRKLAKVFHPDKLNPPQTMETEEDISQWKSETEAKFISMREAYEILSDSTKQWAYDRFGPTVVQWKNCVTMREYLVEGLKQSAPFYVVTLASLSVVASIRKTDAGSYWRWTSLLCILAAESIILTSTTVSSITGVMSIVFPNRAPFEYVALLRKLLIAASCVATQLSAILYPLPDEASKNQTVTELIAPLVPLVELTKQCSTLANVEVIKLMFNDLHPILRKAHLDRQQTPEAKELPAVVLGKSNASENDQQVNQIIDNLKQQMLDTFCDLKLQSDPIGQAAWIQAIQRSSASQ